MIVPAINPIRVTCTLASDGWKIEFLRRDDILPRDFKRLHNAIDRCFKGALRERRLERHKAEELAALTA